MKVIQKYKYWKYSNLSMLQMSVQMSVQMYDLYIQMPNFILKKIILMYKSQFLVYGSLFTPHFGVLSQNV